MRLKLSIALAAACLSVATAPAHASIYTWSFDAVGVPITGSGTLDTFTADPGLDAITKITGTWNGVAISWLLPSDALNGNDNALYPTSTPLLDAAGFCFFRWPGVCAD